ncbi:MAG: 50S ribosomal protein L11 methyltransferase [candidate division WOR-3 bacterium]
MYELIHIYEFEGDLAKEASQLSDDDYIGFWKEAGYSFFFFKKPKRALLEKLPVPIRSELTIKHEDWESGTPLTVLQVGRITLHPPWLSPADTTDIRICIDPGMAFGSGHHPSTKGCLRLLQHLFQEHTPERVLDLGTGSGILSIACLKLGSYKCYAVDSNNLAIDTARKNRTINGVTDKMHIVMGNALDFLHVPSDLLVANMHHAVIDEITDREEFFTKQYYLLSGLLGSQGARIKDKLAPRLEFLDAFSENYWFSYLFKYKF